MLCVKNHYRRSHCPKMLACSKCGAKRFSVVADLKTHEKHCGKDRWVCSCGTTFSRKDKLTGHLALFVGHAPAAAVAAGDGSASVAGHDAAGTAAAAAVAMLGGGGGPPGALTGSELLPPAAASAAMPAGGQHSADQDMEEGEVMPPPVLPRREGEGEGEGGTREMSSCSSGGEVGENEMRAHRLALHAPPLRDCISSNLNLNHASASLHVSGQPLSMTCSACQRCVVLPAGICCGQLLRDPPVAVVISCCSCGIRVSACAAR